MAERAMRWLGASPPRQHGPARRSRSRLSPPCRPVRACALTCRRRDWKALSGHRLRRVLPGWGGPLSRPETIVVAALGVADARLGIEPLPAGGAGPVSAGLGLPQARFSRCSRRHCCCKRSSGLTSER
jgi:hypothetical protein